MAIDDIRRTTGPETRNGRQWEVQLSSIPSQEWLALFQLVGESRLAAPRRVDFDRDTACFKSDEQHVERWIRSIDEGIAATNTRYTTRLDDMRLARAARENAEASERERIRLLNERFKHL